MLVAQLSLTLQPCGLQPARLLCPCNSPGKNTGVGSCSFLQGIFPTQGSNLNLLHCRQILYHLSHQTGKERQDNRFTLPPEKSKQTINCPSLLPERESRLQQRGGNEVEPDRLSRVVGMEWRVSEHQGRDSLQDRVPERRALS